MRPPASERVAKVPWSLRYKTGAHLASEMRKLLVLATHRHCHIEFRGPVRLGPGFELVVPDHGRLIVGVGVDFRRGFVCEISGDGKVVIGDGTTFTSNALVQCSTSIEIGRRCVFGQSLQMVDGSHAFRDPERHPLDQGYDYRPLAIADDVMVMSKCTIFADIGERTFVGAHSVVSKPLPPRCLAMGAPAKPVEFFEKDPAQRTNGHAATAAAHAPANDT